MVDSATAGIERHCCRSGSGMGLVERLPTAIAIQVEQAHQPLVRQDPVEELERIHALADALLDDLF